MQLSGLDLRVSSEMLTDQRVGSAVAGSSDLVGVSTTHGAEVLFQAQDGSLHNVHRDPASDSGWVSTPLPPIHGASGLTVAQAGGVPTALCIGTNLAAPSLWTSTRSGSSWSAWAERPVPAQARQNYIVRVVPDLSGAAATVYLFLRGSSASPTPGALTLWRIDWTTNVWTSLGGVASTQGAAVNLNGSEGFVAFVGTETPNRWALVLHPMDGTPTPVANTLAVRQLATVRDASGRSSVFLYDPGLLTGTPRLAVVKAPTSTNPPVIDTGVSLQGLLPVDAGAATEALYALGRDGSLLAFHPSGATASGWTSTPMPLGVHLSDAVSVLGQDGSPTLFGLDHADQFVRLTLPVGADGTSGMWEQETVDLPAQSMVRVDAYATHLSVTDASGRPRLFETVALYADEVVSAEVNHEHVVLGPTTPTSVTTDGNGQITILSATDSLQSADLRVTVGEGADASTAHAARTGTTLKRLKGTTQAQLGTILPASMKPHAAVIQEALQRTAALAPAPSGCDPHHLAPIDADALADMNWVFSVQGNDVSFTPTSADEAAALMDSYRASGVTFDSPEGWLSEAWSWLGDTLEAVAEEAVEAVKLTVQAATDAAHIVLDCVIDGVQYVFSAVVKVVRDVLAFAEGIFNAVKTAFSTLFGFYGWLLDGARQDIWYTHEAFGHVTTLLATKVDGWLETLIEQTPAKVAAAVSQADAAIDRLIAKWGSEPLHPVAARSLGRLGAPQLSLDDAVDEAKAVALWLLHRLSGPGIDYDPPWNTLSQVGDALRDMFTSVTSDVWEALRTHVDNIGTYLSQSANDPASLGALTFEFVLKEVKVLIGLVGHVLGDLAVGILKVVKTLGEWIGGGVLSKPITGFFIPEVYNLVNPGPREAPTAVSIATLLTAFPLTVVYRRLLGVSPFDSDWAATLSPLEALLDPPGPGAAPAIESAAAKKAGQILGGLWAVGYTLVWLPLEVGNDLTPDEVKKSFGLWRLLVVVGCEAVLYVIGVLAALVGFHLALTHSLDFWSDIVLLVAWGLPVAVDLIAGVLNILNIGDPTKLIPTDAVACFLGIVIFAVGLVSLATELLEEESSVASAVLHLVSPFALILKPLQRLPPAYGIKYGPLLVAMSDAVADGASSLAAGAIAAGRPNPWKTA